MKLAASLTTLAVYVSQVAAVVPAWGQCGGINYTGETRQHKFSVTPPSRY